MELRLETIVMSRMGYMQKTKPNLEPRYYETNVFLYFKKNQTTMSPEDKKINDELIEKYSKLLTDLATDD